MLHTEFERLIREHEAVLYRLAYRMTGNHDDAQDLVQDVVLEAFQYLSRFKEGSRFDRWIYRVMTHTYIDQVRWRRRRGVIRSLDDAGGVVEGDVTPSGVSPVHAIADPAPGPEERLMRSTLDESWQQALDSLPAAFRLVVILFDMEGLTYEEIARILHCPIGTVRSRLSRGRDRLRTLLKPQLLAPTVAGGRSLPAAGR